MKSEQEEIIQPKKYYWYQCTVCKSNFSLESRGCPRCRKMTKTIVKWSENPKSRIIQVKERCYTCPLYNRDCSKGPKCDKFSAGFADLGICKDCICKECCQLEYDFKEHPTEHENIAGLQKLINEKINAK